MHALWAVSGLIYTEIEALEELAGVEVYPVGAGGIAGAEGGLRLWVGTPETVRRGGDRRGIQGRAAHRLRAVRAGQREVVMLAIAATSAWREAHPGGHQAARTGGRGAGRPAARLEEQKRATEALLRERYAAGRARTSWPCR